MHGRTTVAPLASHGHSARAVVRELLVHGPLHRAELARRLRLSPAALTRLTRDLLESGAITEIGTRASGRGGRTGTQLDVAHGQHHVIGVKVTADAVYGVRTDSRGEVQQELQQALPSTDVDAVVHAIVHLVNDLRAQTSSVEALGVGIAGAMSRFDDHVRDSLYVGWDKVPLADLLEQECGLPTVIGNDVRALTAGVHWCGPGRGLSDLAVVTTGVGIGLGLVIDGHTVAGASGRAGLIAHQQVDPSGPLCHEGHRGCAESYLTTAAITSAVGIAHRDPVMTLERVCALADRDDPAACRVLADAGRALGALIAHLVNTVDLQTVVLAGDGLPAIVRAEADVQRSLAQRLDRNARRPQLHMLESGFPEWARGAAVLACQWLLLTAPPVPNGS